METSTLKKRTTELDALKGILIVLMVYGHVVVSMSPDSGSAQSLLWSITEVMHTFRMPLFLILCGYFFSPQRPTPQLLRRAIRGLLVPYAVFQGIYVLLLMLAISQGIKTDNYVEPSLQAFVRTLLLEPVGPFWFIQTLALFQIATALSVYLSRKLNLETWLPFLACFVLLFIHFEITTLWSIEFLMIGLLLKQYKAGMPSSIAEGALVVAVVAATFGVPYESATQQPNAMIHGVWVLGLLAVANGLLQRSAALPGMNLWRFLGQNTLIIMLTHGYFFGSVKRVLSAQLNAVDSTGILYVLLGTAAGVTGPLLLALIIDRLKLTAVLFDKERLFIPWKPAAGPGAAAPAVVAPPLAEESHGRS